MSGQGALRLVTVVTTSPLTVRETVGARPLPARPVNGYTATVGRRVLAGFAAGTYYLFGDA